MQRSSWYDVLKVELGVKGQIRLLPTAVDQIPEYKYARRKKKAKSHRKPDNQSKNDGLAVKQS